MPANSKCRMNTKFNPAKEANKKAQKRPPRFQNKKLIRCHQMKVSRFHYLFV